MITTILAMACMVWLIGENRAYKAQYEKQRNVEAALVDQYFDLKEEYERCFDNVLTLEINNASLRDSIGKLELGLGGKR
jgi:hypothetical protein